LQGSAATDWRRGAKTICSLTVIIELSKLVYICISIVGKMKVAFFVADCVVAIELLQLSANVSETNVTCLMDR